MWVTDLLRAIGDGEEIPLEKGLIGVLQTLIGD